MNALTPAIAVPDTTLDPGDFGEMRRLGHRMLDEMFDHLEGRRDRPVWRPIPEETRARMNAPLPWAPSPLAQVYDDFRETILPFDGGNTHPGFMGWVQGAGTPVGMLAEMLAGGMNANLGGRDHMPIAVERQIVTWMRALFAYPDTADGLFLTGASQANFVALHVARTRVCGTAVRQDGLAAHPGLVAYASAAVHGCVPRACEMAGLGTAALRRIAVDGAERIDTAALDRQIAHDKAAGLVPFMIVGTAGTVNTGAIDDLAAMAEIATRHDLHFHVDGALGALAMLADDLAPLLAGIERSDSIAFDFHKWGHVPYDAGFLLVRDGAWQRAAFAAQDAYLTRADTGLAGGAWWPCDTGPDLSRGFRALKTWFTLRTYGLAAIGTAIAANCDLAQALAARVGAHPDLVLLAPVALNIVCFAYAPGGAAGDGACNRRIVERLHIAGQVAPSLTLVDGMPAIRAAFVNHRSTIDDVDRLVAGVLACGAADACHT